MQFDTKTYFLQPKYINLKSKANILILLLENIIACFAFRDKIQSNGKQEKCQYISIYLSLSIYLSIYGSIYTSYQMSLKSASNLEHREPTLLSDISIYLCLSLYLK